MTCDFFPGPSPNVARFQVNCMEWKINIFMGNIQAMAQMSHVSFYSWKDFDTKPKPGLDREMKRGRNKIIERFSQNWNEKLSICSRRNSAKNPITIFLRFSFVWHAIVCAHGKRSGSVSEVRTWVECKNWTNSKLEPFAQGIECKNYFIFFGLKMPQRENARCTIALGD